MVLLNNIVKRKRSRKEEVKKRKPARKTFLTSQAITTARTYTYMHTYRDK